MRPIRLVMQAFGPYAGREELDFTALPDGALFLVHGPTGAGKTTVLDAICYGLYGETSGAERGGGDMRTDLADPATLTEVIFDFALGERVHRVHRIPEQERPKKRGDGLTRQAHDATLYLLDEDGEESDVLARGVGPVHAAVVERLRFKEHQFRQVVVLPQGRFRSLLTGDSKAREEILETLFGTEHYRRIERMLRERASSLLNELKALRAREDQASGDAAHDLGIPADGPRDLPSLRAAWQRLDERGAKAKDLKEAARKAAERTSLGLQAGRAAAEKFEELQQAELAVEQLAAAGAQVAAQTQELETARRAAPLEPLASAARKAGLHLQRAATQVAELTATVHAAEKSATQARAALADADSEEARARRAAVAKRVHELDDMAPQIATLTAARKALAEATTGHERRAARHQDAQRAVEVVRAEHEAAQATFHEIREQAAGLDAARHTSKEAALVAERAASLARAEAGLQDATAASAQATDTHARAEQHMTAADEALRAAIHLRDAARAQRLAATLRAGEPCPVCGSTEHPSPAAATEDVPTDADIERREQERTKAQGALRAAEALRVEMAKALAAAQEKRDGLSRTLGEHAPTPPAALAKTARTAAERLADLERRCATVPALEQRLDELARRTAEAEAVAKQCEGDVAAAKQLLETSAATIAVREEAVPEDLRAPGALDTALETSRAESRQLEEALLAARKASDAAREAHVEARTALTSAQEQERKRRAESEEAAGAFRGACDSAGFADAAAFADAVRTPEVVAQLDAVVQTHARQTADAEGRRERARTAVTDLESPDLPQLEQANADAAEAARKQADAYARIDADARRLAARLDDLEGMAQQSAELDGTYGLIGGLAAAARGDNPQRLSFQRFVLAALLDEVLDVASTRLVEMSSGRYRLVRRTVPADQRRASGLELDVHDDWSGRTRPAATLSGGEGFLAALALALATADVVQRHAGGIRLDAVFIDEGFGSLDEEALDRAIDVLMALGRDGRLVGVISHVSELRRRIDCRLEVTAGRSGSRARFVTP